MKQTDVMKGKDMLDRHRLLFSDIIVLALLLYSVVLQFTVVSAFCGTLGAVARKEREKSQRFYY